MSRLFSRYFHTGAVLCTSIGILFAYVTWLLFSVPSDFPVGKKVGVFEGESVKTTSVILRKEGYIRSGLFFRALMSFGNYDKKLKVGYYQFNSPLSLVGLVYTMMHNGPAFPLAQITIPEGSTDKEVADIVHEAIPTISIHIFGEAVSKMHATGMLFPETYNLVPSATAEDIVLRMKNLFAKRVTDAFDTTVISNDTLILASILEGEAKNEVDMKIVSGILHRRLQMGMALQVDVAKETYTRRGLPYAPLNSPGIIALDAALHPTATSYLYYITGKDGTMHYAKTFDEHKKNIQKYLK